MSGVCERRSERHRAGVGIEAHLLAGVMQIHWLLVSS